MENLDIRSRAITKGVLLWEIAEAIGITDATLSRRLRRELPADERERVLKVIEQIADERKGGAVDG